ncbi:hypothetical protein G7054_g2870 [Neopestalotiopsis clavispora]|nr:hypothetical protein G7054_g2870 [Neopestalotiopsis clavispora]
MYCTGNAIVAPVFDRMSVTTQEKHFNNTFWPDVIPSIFQQLPSPEVDRGWERYGDTKAIAIRRNEIDRLGLDARSLWPWPEDVAGPDEYMDVLDMFHQIHCLDHLRRVNFPEYYGDLKTKYENATFSFEQHNLHCQNLLLNVITCHADLEIVTFNKVEGIHGPFADFSANRKCRNFEDILAWKEENEIGLTAESMKTPDSIVELDAIGRAKPWPA